MARRKKKLCWHSTFGDIAVIEPLFRRGKKTYRAFSTISKLKNRSCSMPLQRAITDFGADVSFGHAMDKLVEHYGVLLSESTVRQVTEQHAKAMYDWNKIEEVQPQEESEVIIVEVDGGMVPIRESNPDSQDKRKGKNLSWKEAKLCLAHKHGSIDVYYGATLLGGVEEAGCHMYDCALMAGFGKRTKIHALGDGAQWICDQVDDKFGAQSSYLLDLYHASEYLHIASVAIFGDNTAAGNQWFKAKKEQLIIGETAQVIAELSNQCERSSIPDSDAPIRSCYRYLSRRKHQLNYQKAILLGLPIGSGEIESAHRYVVQARMKLSGAWWDTTNAEHMLTLRANRKNKKWTPYWNNLKKAA